MRKFLIAIFASVLLMLSCKGVKTAGDDGMAPADSVAAADTAAVDTMEQLISDTPMPKAADELFDDFFFNYAANRRLQLERTRFPLPVTTGERVDSIEKRKWKTEHFFMHQGYYTLLFPNYRQMELVKDTAVCHVVVESIHFDIKTVKQYIFDRIGGLWMLDAINIIPLYKSENVSFLNFYRSFVTDSTFQTESIHDPVQFVGPDPDDDFEQMEGVISPDSWPAFAPELPQSMIYNINYGQKTGKSNRVIFMMRGISNGLEIELTFERKGGKWMLVKMTT